MSELIKRTCPLCKVMMLGGLGGFIAHAAEHHPNHVFGLCVDNKTLSVIEKNYFCPLNDQWYGSLKYLSRELTKRQISNEDYYRVCGEEYLPDRWKKNCTDPVLGDARNTETCLQCGAYTAFDEGHWEYAAFCSFPCSTTWYAQNTDRPARAMQTIKERQIDNPDLNLRPNQIKYWTNQGLNDVEARQKVKERQSTNSLAAFIKRAGGDIECGKVNHAARQEKWLKSLQESGLHTGFSGVASALFETIGELKPGLKYGANEAIIKLETRYVKADCADLDNRKVIEFYGDYWHGNPEKYGPADTVCRDMTAEARWAKDAKRNKALADAGYDVLIVWENDFRKDPETVIAKCLAFLA